MKHKAYQIVNFKDPLSVKYFEHSQKSLKLIEDVLDVEPVQCVTPEEVNDYNWPWRTDGKKGKNRSIYEKACFLSHIKLVRKIASGEKFFVLEHDVYVWPDDKRLLVLYDVLSRVDQFIALYPGISNEFYTMDNDIAGSWLKLVKNTNQDYGPLGAIREILRLRFKKNQIPKNKSIIFPTCRLNNKIGIDRNIENIIFEKNASLLPAPITQHYILNKGSTIRTRNVDWIVTRENNPNFYFTEE